MNDCIQGVVKGGNINMNHGQQPMIVLSETHENIDTSITYAVHAIMILILHLEQCLRSVILMIRELILDF